MQRVWRFAAPRQEAAGRLSQSIGVPVHSATGPRPRRHGREPAAAVISSPRSGGEVNMVAYAGSHVVVTGGTGALGRAVVAALRAGGAVCHVPNLVAAELAGFPPDPLVHVVRDVDLADE